MYQGIEHAHRINPDHWFFASACFHLRHTETFQTRRRCINIAGANEVRHEIARNGVGGVGDVFFNAQLFGHFQIGQILQFGAGLWPYFAHIFPIGRFGVNDGQCLHDFLRTFRSGIAPHGKDHELIGRNAQRCTHCHDFRIVFFKRNKPVGINPHRQNDYFITINAIADIHFFHPIGRNQNERKRIEHFLIIGNITIGHEPRNGLYPIALWVQH